MAERGRPRNFDRTNALDRALHAFWRDGFEATSMTDLVAAMGINSPSIYAAFGSKEALFAETVQHYRTAYAAKLPDVLNEAPDAASGIKAMLSAAIDLFTRKDTPGGCFVVNAMASNCPRNPDILELLTRFRCERSKQIASRLYTDIQSGRLRADMPVSALADLAATILQGLAVGGRDGIDKERLQAMLAPIASILTAWQTNARS